MSDITALAVTPEGLLTAASSHLSAARDSRGTNSAHHAEIARIYSRCASLLNDDPASALDVNEAVSLLHDARKAGPHAYGDPQPDYAALADLRVTMARIASRHRGD
jgi:hypothetical protein